MRHYNKLKKTDILRADIGRSGGYTKIQVDTIEIEMFLFKADIPIDQIATLISKAFDHMKCSSTNSLIEHYKAEFKSIHGKIEGFIFAKF